MIKTIYFLLIPYILLSNEYPHFTKKDFLSIEKQSGRIAKNRAMDYQEKVLSFKSFKKTKQINIVNNYLNQLLPQYDAVIQNQEDYWASPKEFLTTGYGDCEDYVIIKYFTLLKLGFALLAFAWLCFCFCFWSLAFAWLCFCCCFCFCFLQ